MTATLIANTISGNECPNPSVGGGGLHIDGRPAVLLAVMKANPAILPDPEPYVLFTGFGDSSLNFVGRAWTDEFDLFQRVRSELCVGFEEALKRREEERAAEYKDLLRRFWVGAALGAPVAIIITIDEAFSREHLVDIGVALGYLMLGAHSLGLGTCPVGLIAGEAEDTQVSGLAQDEVAVADPLDPAQDGVPRA